MTTPEPSAPEPSELLPCPFCGSEASLFVNETFTGHNYVFCEGEDCHVSTPYSSDINVVIRGWNRRAALKPSPSPVVVEPAAIRAMLEGARQWIVRAPHGDNCFLHDDGGEYDACFCGKDSLLDAIDQTLSGPPQECESILKALADYAHENPIKRPEEGKS